MIYEFLIPVIIIAFLKKGSLRHLSETEIRKQWVILSGFLLQLIAMFLYHRVSFINQSFAFWVVVSYLMLIYGCWCNRHLPGIKLFILGTLLNFLVIIANGGRMPVSLDALEWAGLSSYIPLVVEGVTKHQPLTESTLLPYLADVIPLRPPFVFSSMVVSPGDIAVTLGISWFIYKGMVKKI
ncbi:DUF5317 domain-containing protein [Carboxydothermus pertinax]|uniref:DUF5317 domain-containing protein n=1 Tax=Carboxydothermus pertinax TaxID=870242 RepID=A0A1L8CRD3_9THEO|nr:DUF5317 domain-containing protein [Carboxydothermus pertinax]GAV21491.1 hypothetical protein cpu_00010 [Carboxydothermus pertinax]